MKKKISVQVLFGVVSKKKKKNNLGPWSDLSTCQNPCLQGSLVSWLLRTLDHAVTLLRELSPLDHRFNSSGSFHMAEGYSWFLGTAPPSC